MSKIISLEMSDVKRIKAVTLEPKDNGLTIIGGRNGQAKALILTGLCAAVKNLCMVGGIDGHTGCPCLNHPKERMMQNERMDFGQGQAA